MSGKGRAERERTVGLEKATMTRLREAWVCCIAQGKGSDREREVENLRRGDWQTKQKGMRPRMWEPGLALERKDFLLL